MLRTRWRLRNVQRITHHASHRRLAFSPVHRPQHVIVVNEAPMPVEKQPRLPVGQFANARRSHVTINKHSRRGIKTVIAAIRRAKTRLAGIGQMLGTLRKCRQSLAHSIVG